MTKIASKFYPRFFFTALFIAIIILAYYIIRPFLLAVLTGAIIAYLAYPIFRKSQKYIRNRTTAAFTVSVLIVLIFSVPFVLVISAVSKEAKDTYLALNRQTDNGNLTLGSNFMRVICSNNGSTICKKANSFIKLLPSDNPDPAEKLDDYLRAIIEKISGFVVANGYSLLVSIPSILLNFFIMLFVIYYLLKDGEKAASRIKNILPLNAGHKKQVVERFHDVTSEVFYANILVAVIQGFLGTVGFLIFGVSSPLLWGAVMTVFALVPYVGTAIIWAPAALNLIFVGYIQNDNGIISKGIFLMLYGLLFVGTVDNLLKPKLIGDKAKIHPILVLLGVLGGLNIFGFIGVILGPLMLAILMTFIEIYEREKIELEKYF